MFQIFYRLLHSIDRKFFYFPFFLPFIEEEHIFKTVIVGKGLHLCSICYSSPETLNKCLEYVLAD